MDNINRRRERRKRKNTPIRTLIVIIIGIGVIWAGWSLRPKAPTKDSSTVKVPRPQKDKKKADKSFVKQETFVIVGLEEQDGKKSAQMVAEVVYDPAQNKIGGLTIDANTYALIPGRGYQSLRDAYAEKPENIRAGIAELTGIEAQEYLSVSSDQFTAIMEQKDITSTLDQYEGNGLSSAAAKTLAKKLANIPKDRIEFQELTVKPILIGEQTYYEPDEQELERLVKLIWGRLPEKKEAAVRVIILNGNGTPGIARKAADRLIGKGFKVIDVKNADNFNHVKSEIIIYSDKAKKSGSVIKKAIGTGVVVEKKMAQDVTDVVILIGKDFN